ncbi:MAG: tRNA pseudouridine(13) synthase TruD [Deltaproteobacteria bacterium]
MKLTLKARPEDFLVREIAQPVWGEKGTHAVYLLTKRNRNTVELLIAIADRLGVPFGRFSYGARKDRRALTHQFVAIAHPKRFELKDKDFTLAYVGRMDRPMGPDLIAANDFTVVVRNLEAGAAAGGLAALDGIAAAGFANYFDDQRFGCHDPLQGFFAEKLLKRQFNGALKVYMTAAAFADDAAARERKRFFFERWRDWDACLKEAKTSFEKRAFARLRDDPKDFFGPLKDIPLHEMTLFVSAYQSFLWNEMLRRLLTDRGLGQRVYEGAVGPYCFWTPGHVFDDGQAFPSLPMPGLRPVFEYTFIKELYDGVLADNGARQALFNKVVPRRVFFKSFPRPSRVRPEGLQAAASADDMYPSRQKLTLSFRLPRGSFATMMIKAAFSESIA